jgi:hypothetical protein
MRPLSTTVLGLSVIAPGLFASHLGCSAFSSSEAPPSATAPTATAPGADAGGPPSREGGVPTPREIRLVGTDQVPVGAHALALTLRTPSATKPDDDLWAAIAVTTADARPPVTAPSPFEERGSRRVQGGCGLVFVMYFHARATSPGVNSYDFGFTRELPATDTSSGLLVAFSGVDPAEPIDEEREGTIAVEVPDGGGSFGYVPPEVTTRTPNATLLVILSDVGGATWSAGPGGFERAADTSVLGAFIGTIPVPGNVLPPRFEATNPTCGVFTAGNGKVVALRPAR